MKKDNRRGSNRSKTQKLTYDLSMGADVHLERMIADLVKKSLWLLPTDIIEDQETLQKFIDQMAAVRDRWN